MAKRADVIPGKVLRIKSNLIVDGHLFLGNKSWITPSGNSIMVLTKPRKIGRINLVRISFSGREGEVFYCDVLGKCH